MIPLKESQVDNLPDRSHYSENSKSRTMKRPWTLEED